MAGVARDRVDAGGADRQNVSMGGNFSLLSLTILLPVAGWAQVTPGPAPLPDPATIQTPDVTPSRDPKVSQDGYKFYYFHSPRVTFVQAYRDLKECRGHLAIGGPAQVPGFVPWDEAHRRRVVPTSSPYGLVGAGLAAIIVPKMERGLQSNKMRRCMGTRGYNRYAITEKAWEMLNDGDEERLVLMQAKLAAGPKPQDVAVTK